VSALPRAGASLLVAWTPNVRFDFGFFSKRSLSAARSDVNSQVLRRRDKRAPAGSLEQSLVGFFSLSTTRFCPQGRYAATASSGLRNH